MKVIKKIRFRHFVKAIRLPLLTALAAALLVDLWCETVGVPDVFAQIVSLSMREKGVACTVTTMKAGIFRGVQARGITVWDGPAGGRKMFYADRAKVSFRKKDMLFRRLIPKRLKVYGGKVFFPVPDGDSSLSPSSFVFEHIYGDIRLSSTAVKIDRLTGTLNGVRLQVKGDLVGFDQRNRRGTIGAPPPSAGGTQNLAGWGHIQDGMPAPLVRVLAKVKDILADQFFIDGDAVVVGEFHADLADFTACSGSLAFQFSGLEINDVPIATLKGRAVLLDKVLELQRASAQLGGDSFASGDARYAFDSGLLSGSVSGAFNPRVVYYFFDTPMPPAAVDITFAVPPRVKLVLSPSPVLSPRDWRLGGTVSAGNAAWRGERLGEVTCVFDRHDRKIRVEKCEIVVDKTGKEAITVQGELDEKGWVLSGQGHVRLNPERLTPFIPPTRPGLLTFWRQLRCQNGDFPEVSVSLKKMSFSPLKITGSARLSGRDLTYKNNTIQRYDVPLIFADGMIQTAPAGVRVAFDDEQAVSVSGAADLAARSFSLNGTGALFPPRLYKSMALPHSYLMDELKMGETPARLSFSMTDAPFSMRNWKLSGQVAAEGFWFGETRVTRAESEFMVGEKMLTLKNVIADSPRIQELTIPELTVTWPRTTVAFSDGKGRLDPRHVAPFIVPSGRAVFLKAFDAFDWGDTVPYVRVKTFIYRYLGSDRWDLNLDGRLTTENMVFEHVPFDTFSARVKLALPRVVDVTDIDITHGEEKATGKVRVDLTGEPILSFDCEGVFDPVANAVLAIPSLGETLADVSASQDSRVRIDGQVYLTGKLRPLINCRMRGGELVARKLPLEGYDVDWNLNNHELRWRINKGGVGGGQLAASGHSNGFTGAGKVDATFKNLSLNELLKSYANVDSSVNLGKVSGELALFSSKAKGAETVTLTGDGKIKIRDGEFNNTFLVQKLVSLIGLGKVGLITACDAELEFCGDYLKVGRLATDGTIVALKGEGTYHWAAKDDQGLNFTVSGEVLKAISLVPLLTKPLSWFFEAQLTGSVHDPVWKMRSPLRMFTPGDNKSVEGDEGIDLDLLPDK
ncbi:MAG: hypothetical protein RRC34_03455 [Lentisphaeria bacterium]|nr:hypothetical protein [Lentisphaeria bacterium]